MTLIAILIIGWLFAFVVVFLSLYKLNKQREAHQSDLYYADRAMDACRDAVTEWQRRALVYKQALIEADIKDLPE